MKAILPLVILCLLLSACDQFVPKKEVISYKELKAEKNYYDSIPHIRVRDMFRPYRYYLKGDPYTGRLEDYYSPGHPKLLGQMKDGYAAGEWKYYFTNDSLQQIGSFQDGYMSGEWRLYGSKGKIVQRVKYTVKGRQVVPDTLIATYGDGSKTERTDNDMTTYYRNGNVQSKISLDGSAGIWMDADGNTTAEMTDYVKKDKRTGDKIYYLAHGRHKVALDKLLASFDWTDYQRGQFATANTVTVSMSVPIGDYRMRAKVRVEE